MHSDCTVSAPCGEQRLGLGLGLLELYVVPYEKENPLLRRVFSVLHNEMQGLPKMMPPKRKKILHLVVRA